MRTSFAGETAGLGAPDTVLTQDPPDSNAAEVMKWLKKGKSLTVQEGEEIADIGAGSGYFTFRLAHPVGDAWRV